MSYLGKLLLYWAFAFRFAVRETFGRALDPVEVEIARELHRELWGEPQ